MPQEEQAGEPVRILLVDDEPLILALLERLLAREGLQTVAAGSGRQGLEALGRYPDIGVIVSDLQMPEMDGAAFLEEARAAAPLAVRIILSGYADLNATVAAINKGGASLYLAKPLDEQQFVLTLREAVRNFCIRRENLRLMETINRQNDELRRWNSTLERRVAEQTAQIRAQNALLQVRSETLQKLTDEFHVILNGIPDSLMHLSVDRRILWANEGAAKRFGRPAAALAGDGCHHLLYGAGGPCLECPAVRTLASGRTEDGVIPSPDGRTWGVKVFPLQDRSGRITGLIEWASDITEKIVLREEANQASRLAALGELAAGVAHEINNPNAVIMLNLPILQAIFADASPILESALRERNDFTLAGVPYAEVKASLPALLTDSLESAERIRRIVEDLKDFVRSEKDGYSEWVDLNQVVETAIRLAGNTLRKATHRLQVDLGADLPLVKGSSRRLEQVTVNLLMNACQSLPENSRGIFVVTRFEPAKSLCIVEVRDEGIGIPAEHLPRIREPFFTTRREQGGTGLGLSVSTRILREHGGRLDFISRPGEGTTALALIPSGPEVSEDV